VKFWLAGARGFPARVFHVKSRVSCGLTPLVVVVYSPSFITEHHASGSPRPLVAGSDDIRP
jgi:hypothetical protein